MESFCKSLPKIELHAHLNGSLSKETLKELRQYNLRNGETQIDDKTWEEKESLIPLRNTCSLLECFEAFNICHSLTTSPEAVKIATTHVIEDFAKDNVVYLELRSTLRQETNMTKDQYLQSMIDAVENCKETVPSITVKLIVSISRKDPIESAEENVNLALNYHTNYPEVIVGIDLSGDPTKTVFKKYPEMLQEARKRGLKVTIHCGEIPDIQEVEDILNFGPDRLGHCTCVHESSGGSAAVWDQLMSSRIPVELCLTSNIKCKTVTKADLHHFRFFHDSGHPICISTDDKGIFGSNLSDEYNLIANTFGLTRETLWGLNFAAIDYIFGTEEEKCKLKKNLSTFREKSEY